jgi:subtilisin family serine protease
VFGRLSNTFPLIVLSLAAAVVFAQAWAPIVGTWKLNMGKTLIVLFLAISTCMSAAWAVPTGEKRVVTNQTQLPRYSYPVNFSASELTVSDDHIFAPFADNIMANVRLTFDQYEITDRATLREQFQLKLNLQVLSGDNEQALITLQQLRAEQDKPDAKLIAGLSDEAILKARTLSGASDGPVYERAVANIYSKLVHDLPWAIVGTTLKEQQGKLEKRTTSYGISVIRRDVDAVTAQSGSIDDAGAKLIVDVRHHIRVIEPVKEVLLTTLRAYIAANSVFKPDIWAEREFTLLPDRKLAPVLVGIWDHGFDTSLFPAGIYVDPHPAQYNVHGLAFDHQGNASKSDLEPLTDEQRARYPRIRLLYQGFSDIQNQIDSPQAQAAHQVNTTAPADQLSDLASDIQIFGHYMHGTHVASIAVRGNAAARLVVIRFDASVAEYPFAPSAEWVTKFAGVFASVGSYCRVHHVRVVNMSWSNDAAEFERWLARTSPETDVDRRKAQALAIYQVWRGAIEGAIRSAPGTLFVAAAGNSDSNAGFDEAVPAFLHLPNLITVGAVDQAGDATTFTSYGETVVVDAAGYQIEGYVPGGERLRLSGTSMAAPNVTNLAAKLFALRPSLTAQQAIILIRKAADTSSDGRLHLINPKATIGLLHQSKGH